MRKDYIIELLYDIEDEKILERISRVVESYWRKSYTEEKRQRDRIEVGISGLSAASLKAVSEYVCLLQTKEATEEVNTEKEEREIA
jgi:hypothetical protein